MKKNIILSTIIFIVAIIFQRYFLLKINFNFSIIGDIITFLSVIFGFYVTSLAIFATSQFVSGLYKVTDKKNDSYTLLHTLINNYKFGLIVVLISLVYFILAGLFIKPDINDQVSLGYFATIPFIALLVLNFTFCFRMLNNLINIIIQEGKIKSR